MSLHSLQEAVDGFARTTVSMTEAQLELPWAWREYDSDGVRFAFFRVLEELRALAVALDAAAREAGRSPADAGRYMDQYHRAWRAMHAALLGVPDEAYEQPPAPDEWPLRRTLAHVIDADVGFYTVCSLALESLRAGEEPPHEVTDEAWLEIVQTLDDDFEDLLGGPTGPLLEFDLRMHRRILEQFSAIPDELLPRPSYYWEGSSYPLSFRLVRFESHCRQHTVQLLKTRRALGYPLSESQLLLAGIYDALAEVENAWRLHAACEEQAAALAKTVQGWAAQAAAAATE